MPGHGTHTCASRRGCKNHIDAVNCEVVDWSRLGHVVENIKAELLWFTKWKISFIN